MAVPSPTVSMIDQRYASPSLISSAVSATAVATNTVLNTIVIAATGTYVVTAWSGPGGTGTIANTDAGNVLLKKNTNQVAVVPQVGSGAVAPLPLVLTMNLVAGDSLTLTVGPTNAAPAAVYYASTLIAQLVG